MQDLQDPLAASRGPTFKCVDGSPGGTCAGFNNIQCQNGGLCVPDPRMEWLVFFYFDFSFLK